MKTTDTLQLLKEWIAEQRKIYSVMNFETDEKKLEAIERQLTLNEVNLQITIFEKLSRENFIDNMPRATNDTQQAYASHITPEFTNLIETFTNNK